MVVSSRPKSTLGASGSSAAGSPVRLGYAVHAIGHGFQVRTRRLGEPAGTFLSEQALKALLSSLHALDVAIVREIVAGSIFGQLSDAQMGRILPLLVQRRAVLDDHVMTMCEDGLSPRVRIAPSGRAGLLLTYGLMDAEGTWIDLAEGRLVAASQAFFLRGARVYPITSPAPWALASWGRVDHTMIPFDLGAASRDAHVRALREVGVPQEDIDQLAVRRGSPTGFVVRFVEAPAVVVSDEEPSVPAVKTDPHTFEVHAVLQATYDGALVDVIGNRAFGSHVATANGDHGLVERDMMAEDAAFQHMRMLGFRFQRETRTFVARDEAALAVLDPHRKLFPAHWHVLNHGEGPRFRDDLQLTTHVQLNEASGLLDVQVDVNVVSDAETAAALIDMRDLLGWLQSGKRYLRLADGSFVTPSDAVRRSLLALEDLGADSARVLVSPLCIGLLRTLGEKQNLIAADAATRAWLEELMLGAGPRQVEPPTGLQGVLRDYQRRGLDWLMMLHRHRLTGILADDMGLGKTLQTLALLCKIREDEGPKPCLVVAPTSVVPVWRDECRRFLPHFKIGLWTGMPEVRRTTDLASCDLVVTSYGILRRDAELLSSTAFRYVILDEAQSAKNANTRNAKAIRQLKSERRLALSGTPIENHPEELWAIFDFLAPGFLGSMRQFRKRYARPIVRSEREAADLLRARVHPLILRRVKKDVVKELPPKVESTVRCEMGSAQRALYDHIAGQLRSQVEEKIAAAGIERVQLDILAALTRLRQVCCDPKLLEAPPDMVIPPSAKLQLFHELMREALASDRRVVVFSQFVRMQRRLIQVIRSLGVDPLWLHGGTRNRDEVVAAFQDPAGPPVIVVSLRAGGAGITLTRADTVIHYDPWWNPAVERQATDRTHRIGQTQTVNVYRLICANTIEEKVAALASKKDALAENLLGTDDGALITKMQPQDVLALLNA